uniref:Acetyltransferase eriL n=1 Tax=Hericium erinaceus TaxID=91752 RepID=ERIL_HERER|nr:RecName: Full=Acetyltransferase eriL; AltName: Full=Erinacine biosynthesis cluster protein L [Hericium erinaceus]BBN60753.1 putative acetyltransferase [Hericium erinaceus]
MSTTLQPLPGGLQVAVQACLFLGAVSRSRRFRALLFPPVLAMSLYMLLYTTTGKDSDDIVTWSLITTSLLQGSDILLINDVADLRLVGQKTPTNELSLWQRIKWAGRLMSAPRAVGFTHESRHVFPPHPPANEPRWTFIKRQSLTTLFYFVVLDLVHTFIVLSPVFQRDGVSLTSVDWPMRFLYTALHAAHLWSYMSFGYSAASVVLVALGVSDSDQWPAIYGDWSNAYTIRRFWGRVWHQVFRRIVSTHGDFVTYRFLALPKGTFFADNVHRYTAFFISGVIHAVGEYGMFRDQWLQKSGALRFFLLQATAILVEQEVGKIFKLQPTPLLRRLGYMWTFLWFVFTLPHWMDPQFRQGMADNYGFPLSVSYGLLKGQWRLVA